ncbi:MAG: mechanosensitive ion channel [Deltaproteobacteria bacterium]|nr:mechanosensitive ion channel [Deltaproteobacteria bacterium]
MDLNAWLFSNDHIETYALSGLIILIGTLVALMAGFVIRRYVITQAKQTTSRVDDLVAGLGSRLISLLIFLAGLHLAIKHLELEPWLTETVNSFFIVAWTLVGAVFLVRLIDGLAENYLNRYARDNELEVFQHLLGTVRSALFAAIWAVAILFVIANLGFDVSSILAGLGLGGLAMALASKDTLSNFFGALTIMINGPYRVGEMIKFQGHTGTVEKVGLRDTRIRTFEGNLVVVPNSLAPTSIVENISRRPRIRVLFELDLALSTSGSQIEEAKKLVRSAIETEDGTSVEILVHFINIERDCAKMQVVYYVEDSSRFLDIRHNVNQKIKRELEQADIAFAKGTFTIKQN